MSTWTGAISISRTAGTAAESSDTAATSFNLKGMLTSQLTDLALPSCFIGSKAQAAHIASAAGRSIGGPSNAVALVTFPFESMIRSIRTVPCRLASLAKGG
jgi:hypothetical protein